MLRTLFGNVGWGINENDIVLSFGELNEALGANVVNSTMRHRFNEIGASLGGGRYGEAFTKAFPNLVGFFEHEIQNLHPVRHFKQAGSPEQVIESINPFTPGQKNRGQAYNEIQGGQLNPHLTHIEVGQIEEVTRRTRRGSGEAYQTDEPVPAITMDTHHVSYDKVTVSAFAEGFKSPANREQALAVLREAGGIIDAARNDKPYDFAGMRNRLIDAGLTPMENRDRHANISQPSTSGPGAVM